MVLKVSVIFFLLNMSSDINKIILVDRQSKKNRGRLYMIKSIFVAKNLKSFILHIFSLLKYIRTIKNQILDYIEEIQLNIFISSFHHIYIYIYIYIHKRTVKMTNPTEIYSHCLLLLWV